MVTGKNPFRLSRDGPEGQPHPEDHLKNKLCFSISMAMVGIATIASAATMPCTPQSTTLTMTASVYSGGLFFPGTVSGGGPVVCGDITFNNFQVFDAAPSTSTGSPFVLLSGTYDGSSA